MTTEEHKQDVSSLVDIEMELIELICATKNDQLMNKFDQWQNQRSKCNDGYKQIIDDVLNSNVDKDDLIDSETQRL